MKVVGLRKTVTTAQGLSVPVTGRRARRHGRGGDAAITQLRPEPLVRALAGSEVREAVQCCANGRGAAH